MAEEKKESVLVLGVKGAFQKAKSFGKVTLYWIKVAIVTYALICIVIYYQISHIPAADSDFIWFWKIIATMVVLAMIFLPFRVMIDIGYKYALSKVVAKEGAKLDTDSKHLLDRLDSGFSGFFTSISSGLSKFWEKAGNKLGPALGTCLAVIVVIYFIGVATTQLSGHKLAKNEGVIHGVKNVIDTIGYTDANQSSTHWYTGLMFWKKPESVVRAKAIADSIEIVTKAYANSIKTVGYAEDEKIQNEGGILGSFIAAIFGKRVYRRSSNEPNTTAEQAPVKPFDTKIVTPSVNVPKPSYPTITSSQLVNNGNQIVIDRSAGDIQN